MPEKDCNQSFICGIEEVKIALFGNGGDNKGAIVKIDEIHKIFTNAKWTGKVLFGIIAGAGVIAASIMGVVELFKRFK